MFRYSISQLLFPGSLPAQHKFMEARSTAKPTGHVGWIYTLAHWKDCGVPSLVSLLPPSPPRVYPLSGTQGECVENANSVMSPLSSNGLPNHGERWLYGLCHSCPQACDLVPHHYPLSFALPFLRLGTCLPCLHPRSFALALSSYQNSRVVIQRA